MIDLILHQLGIKPEQVQKALADFTAGAKAMRQANARIERIEKALGITDPLPEEEEANGTGKRDAASDGANADRNGRGARERRRASAD